MIRNTKKVILFIFLIIFCFLTVLLSKDIFLFLKEWDQEGSSYYLDPIELKEWYAQFRGVHWAAKKGEEKRLKRIIEKHPDAVNKRDLFGRTPLHLSVQNGRAGTACLLLASGARIYVEDGQGRNVIEVMEASRNRMQAYTFRRIHGEILQYRSRYAHKRHQELRELIKQDGLKQFSDSWQKLPELARTDIVKIDSKYTPNLLKIAAEKGEAEICRFLIDHGTQAHIAKGGTPSALYLAAKNGRVEVAKVILRYAISKETINAKVHNPLLAAFQETHHDIFKLLLKHGANSDIKFKSGKTVLHLAVEKGMPDLVASLLHHRVRINSADDRGRTPLFYALKGARIDIARQLLAGSAKPEMVDTGAFLIEAAARDDVRLMEFILSLDIDASINEVKYTEVKYTEVDYKDKTGATALHIAAGNGRIDAVEFLVSRGALLEARNQKGMTPLFLASARGRIGVVKFLLARKAEANAKDTAGFTPLHGAAGNGHPEAVEELLLHGADIDAGVLEVKNEDGTFSRHIFTPLHFAVIHGRKETLNLLLEKGSRSINKRFSYIKEKGIGVRVQNATPLHWAVVINDLEMCELLIAHGAEVNSQGAQGWLARKDQEFEDFSPLHLASYPPLQVGHNILALLLAQGADPNLGGGQGRTPLHLACTGAETASIKLLIENGADVIEKDSNGRTALHIAAIARRRHWQTGGDGVEVPGLLISNGAKAGERDKDGITALHIASQHSDIPLAKLLIENGADIKARDSNGRTPIHEAALSDHNARSEILAFLVENGADINARYKDGETMLEKAAKKNDPWVVNDLLSNGADVKLEVCDFIVNDVEFKNATFLHLAAAQYRAGLTQALIKAGFDVNAKDSEGNSPLHVAVQFGGGQTMSYLSLLENGADCNARNNMGRTPLHIAVEYGAVDIMQRLLPFGADTNAKDNDGRTPLHLAVLGWDESFRPSADDVDNYIYLLIKNGADPGIKDNQGNTPLDLAVKKNNEFLTEILKSYQGEQ